MRIINHQYSVEFKETLEFKFDVKNQIVDLTKYKVLEDQISTLATLLNENPNTRQAVIVLATQNDLSCLINLQYLIVNGHDLYCIANYRSQHITLGEPNDTQMLNYLTSLLLKKLSHNVDKINILVNVADYHYY